MVDEELHTFFNEQARGVDTFVYGRRMYELMAAYWPTADTLPGQLAVEVEFAAIWKNTLKVVFSKTLDKVEWNSRLARDGVAEEIAKLKAQPGRDLGIGGAHIAGQCMRLGLIDEYQLFVNPVVLGGGTPFFGALDTPIKMRLMETRTFRAGVVYLRYAAETNHAA
jgi:dihydrofolate reductase